MGPSLDQECLNTLTTKPCTENHSIKQTIKIAHDSLQEAISIK